MLSKQLSARILGTLLFLAGTLGSVYAVVGMALPDSILVVPPRYRTVELGFDMMRLRHVWLISYRTDTRSDTALFVWNGREWTRLGIQEYQSGSFLPAPPARIIAIGDDTVLPGILSSAPAWCPVLERITSLDTTVQINRLGTLLRFAARDWVALAAKYNLTLVDRNSQRRKWGRFGPPGTAVEQPEGIRKPDAKPLTMPPELSVLEESSKIQPLLPAAKPAAQSVPLPEPIAPAPVAVPPVQAPPIPETATTVATPPLETTLKPESKKEAVMTRVPAASPDQAASVTTPATPTQPAPESRTPLQMVPPVPVAPAKVVPSVSEPSALSNQVPDEAVAPAILLLRPPSDDK